MSSVTKGFNLNLTNEIDLPDLSYINELAREKSFEFTGNFRSAPPIISDLFYLFEMEREEGLDFDVKNHLFSPKVIQEQILEREMTESERVYFKYTSDFLSGLNYTSCTGYSPMDKALNTIMYLTKLAEDKQGHDSTSDPKGTGKSNVTPESLESMMKQMSKGVPGEEEEGQKDQSGKPLNKDILSCVRDFLYDLTPGIANIMAAEKVTDVPINPRILKDMKIKSYLSDKLGMETELERSLVENNSSTKKRIKSMESHSQIMKTSKTQMIMPNFDDKLAKKELSIKQKVLPETRKQIVTFMLDDSGSMGDITKQSYVRATLLKYLEGVTAGKAKLNFYNFESQRYGYQEVKDLKGAQDLFRYISLRRPSGGGTNIGLILQQTIDEIAVDTAYHDPEIVIVNDGDDHVDPSSINTKGVKINAVMLGRDNPNLRKVCEESGGWATVEKLYEMHR